MFSSEKRPKRPLKTIQSYVGPFDSDGKLFYSDPPSIPYFGVISLISLISLTAQTKVGTLKNHSYTTCINTFEQSRIFRTRETWRSVLFVEKHVVVLLCGTHKSSQSIRLIRLIRLKYETPSRLTPIHSTHSTVFFATHPPIPQQNT